MRKKQDGSSFVCRWQENGDEVKKPSLFFWPQAERDRFNSSIQKSFSPPKSVLRYTAAAAAAAVYAECVCA